jgi:hypothetical protein
MKKKRCKVIMLPTKNETELLRNTYCFTEAHGNPLRLINDLKDKNNLIERGFEYQHLYIISDDKIEAGDWVIYKDNFLDGNVKTQEDFNAAKWNIKQCISKEEAAYTERAQFGRNNDNGICGCYKVIATTDPELRSDGLIEDPNNPKDNLLIRKGLPQPSQAFIEKYCKVGGIDEVDVEYEYYYEGSKARIIIQNGNDPIIECDDEEFQVKLKNLEYRLKISSDNTINIHPIKDTYTREEVEQLCNNAMVQMSDWKNEITITHNLNILMSRWIKENL